MNEATAELTAPAPETKPAAAPKRRKRAGSKSAAAPRPGPATAPKDDARAKGVKKMAQSIRGGHELAAMFTGLRSLLLDEKQAALLAEPAYDVCKKYDLDGLLDYVIGPETALLGALVMVYGPMLRMMQAEVQERQRAAQARPAGAQDANGNVFYPDFAGRPVAPDQPMPPAPQQDSVIRFGEPGAEAVQPAE